MRYPSDTIERHGGATAFAKLASAHETAPRKLTPAAVYMWAQRDFVPYMWRDTVRALSDTPDSEGA